MYLTLDIDDFDDLKTAVKLIGDYGSDCKMWAIKGTICNEKEDD